MSEQRTKDQDIYEEAGVTVAKLGEDQWCVEAPKVGPNVVKNRNLANKIFEMAHRCYRRGRGDAFKELRQLIGVD